MSWKKVGVITSVVIIVVGVLAAFRMRNISSTASDAAVQSTAISDSELAQRKELLEQKVGGREEKTTVVKAKQVSKISYDPSYQEAIKDLLEQRGKEKSQYNELADIVRSMMKDQNCDIFGCKEVYVSEIPVFGYDAFSREINYNTPQLIVYSDDYKKMAVCRLQWDNGSYHVSDFGDIDSDRLQKLVSGEEKDSIISIYGEGNEYWLTSDNAIHNQPTPPEIELDGDVYGKLSKSELAISTKKLRKGEKIKISL